MSIGDYNCKSGGWCQKLLAQFVCLPLGMARNVVEATIAKAVPLVQLMAKAEPQMQRLCN